MPSTRGGPIAQVAISGIDGFFSAAFPVPHA
jgi:hypothetical protein